MERIGSSVDRELRRFGAHGAMPAIVAAWPEAVGPEIARNAWPARVARDGVLHVHTSSSAWSFELTQLTAAVLGHLAAALGEDVPRGLRFAPGPIPEPPSEVEPTPLRTALEPTAETVARAAELTAPIADEELRERVSRAAALSLERARSDRRF